jgi:aspartate racemase
MYSFDFQEIVNYNQKEDFESIGKRMMIEAGKLEAAGAELLMLGANTVHQWAEQIREHIEIPLIHIADATGRAIRKSGVKSVLLLGTIYTMEGAFIRGILEREYGIHVIIPEKDDREKISTIIYEELVRGQFKESATSYLLEVIDHNPTAEGVILGCTELPLVLNESHHKIPMFNTTQLHAFAAVDAALSQ